MSEAAARQQQQLLEDFQLNFAGLLFFYDWFDFNSFTVINLIKASNFPLAGWLADCEIPSRRNSFVSFWRSSIKSRCSFVLCKKLIDSLFTIWAAQSWWSIGLWNFVWRNFSCHAENFWVIGRATKKKVVSEHSVETSQRNRKFSLEAKIVVVSTQRCSFFRGWPVK